MSRWVCVAGLLLGSVMVGGCGFDGGPIINEDIGTTVNDDKPLSVAVKQALRKAPQTAIESISVTSVTEDSVRLSGYVSDEATRVEAERVAGAVPGVRFVVNTLALRR